MSNIVKFKIDNVTSPLRDAYVSITDTDKVVIKEGYLLSTDAAGNAVLNLGNRGAVGQPVYIIGDLKGVKDPVNYKMFSLRATIESTAFTPPDYEAIVILGDSLTGGYSGNRTALAEANINEALTAAGYAPIMFRSVSYSGHDSKVFVEKFISDDPSRTYVNLTDLAAELGNKKTLFVDLYGANDIRGYIPDPVGSASWDAQLAETQTALRQLKEEITTRLPNADLCIGSFPYVDWRPGMTQKDPAIYDLLLGKPETVGFDQREFQYQVRNPMARELSPDWIIGEHCIFDAYTHTRNAFRYWIAESEAVHPGTNSKYYIIQYFIDFIKAIRQGTLPEKESLFDYSGGTTFSVGEKAIVSFAYRYNEELAREHYNPNINLVLIKDGLAGSALVSDTGKTLGSRTYIYANTNASTGGTASPNVNDGTASLDNTDINKRCIYIRRSNGPELGRIDFTGLPPLAMFEVEVVTGYSPSSLNLTDGVTTIDIPDTSEYGRHKTIFQSDVHGNMSLTMMPSDTLHGDSDIAAIHALSLKRLAGTVKLDTNDKYFTFNSQNGNRKGWMTFPDVNLTGDFRLRYTGCNGGTPIGNLVNFNNVVREDFEIIRFGNNRHIIDTSFLNVLDKPVKAERVYDYEVERLNNVLVIRVYDTITGDLITESNPYPDAIGTLFLNSIFKIGPSVIGQGAVHFIIEDLTDPASTQNRHYPLEEPFGDDVAVELLNGQHGEWNDRLEDSVVRYLRTPSGLTLDSYTRLKTHSYDPASMQVFVTFSASILRAALLDQEAQMQYLFAERGLDVAVHQYGRGGEVLTTAIDTLPGYLADLATYGYNPSNVEALGHIGGNDVTNSLSYESFKDTSHYILNFRERIETYFNLIKAEGYNIQWLPISWRNYLTVPPEDNGSLPYNINLVLPFIRDVVGQSSWVNDSPRYDFYNFTKREFARNPAFYVDRVHPSKDVGAPIIRAKFIEWFSPLFVGHTPVNGPKGYRNLSYGTTMLLGQSQAIGTLDPSFNTKPDQPVLDGERFKMIDGVGTVGVQNQPLTPEDLTALVPYSESSPNGISTEYYTPGTGIFSTIRGRDVNILTQSAIGGRSIEELSSGGVTESFNNTVKQLDFLSVAYPSATVDNIVFIHGSANWSDSSEAYASKLLAYRDEIIALAKEKCPGSIPKFVITQHGGEEVNKGVMMAQAAVMKTDEVISSGPIYALQRKYPNISRDDVLNGNAAGTERIHLNPEGYDYLGEMIGRAINEQGFKPLHVSGYEWEDSTTLILSCHVPSGSIVLGAVDDNLPLFDGYGIEVEKPNGYRKAAVGVSLRANDKIACRFDEPFNPGDRLMVGFSPRDISYYGDYIPNSESPTMLGAHLVGTNIRTTTEHKSNVLRLNDTTYDWLSLDVITTEKSVGVPEGVTLGSNIYRDRTRGYVGFGEKFVFDATNGTVTTTLDGTDSTMPTARSFGVITNKEASAWGIKAGRTFQIDFNLTGMNNAARLQFFVGGAGLTITAGDLVNGKYTGEITAVEDHSYAISIRENTGFTLAQFEGVLSNIQIREKLV